MLLTTKRNSSTSSRVTANERKRQRNINPTALAANIDDNYTNIEVNNQSSLSLTSLSSYNCPFVWLDDEEVKRHCEYSITLESPTLSEISSQPSTVAPAPIVTFASSKHSIIAHSQLELIRRIEHHQSTHKIDDINNLNNNSDNKGHRNYQCSLCGAQLQYEGSARLHLLQSHSNLNARLQWQGKPEGRIIDRNSTSSIELNSDNNHSNTDNPHNNNDSKNANKRSYQIDDTIPIINKFHKNNHLFSSLNNISNRSSSTSSTSSDSSEFCSASSPALSNDEIEMPTNNIITIPNT